MTSRLLHRQLARIAGVVALLWAATGFLHPVMTWTAPRPAVQAPPVQSLALDGLVPPATALAAQGLRESALVRLVMVGGAPYWFAADGIGERVVVDARSGARAQGMEQRHAVSLARHYAGLPQSEVAQARLISAFSTDYPSVNRLLPVWEVRLATPDGLTLYVDTGLDRLAAVTNDQRRVLLGVFQNVHTLKFLEFVEPLRIAIILLLIGIVLATAVFGGLLLWKARGKGVRRVHALVGWVTLPLLLMFTLSGLLHLVMTSAFMTPPLPSAAQFRLADLTSPPGAEAGIPVDELSATAGVNEAPVWRLQVQESGYYSGPNAPDTDAGLARFLAQAPSESAVSVVRRFGDGYGFINKRLPVWRVETPGGPVYVDVREGLIAASPPATWLSHVEGWTFANLHKWEFLNPLGRFNRDLATMAAAAIIIVSSILGLLLVLRSRRRSDFGPGQDR